MIKHLLPQHLKLHAETIRELTRAGLPIECAIHRVVAIYSLANADKTALYLDYYYAERDRINGLINDYEKEVTL